jgi:uncharacterized protein YecE (DUF72 family)
MTRIRVGTSSWTDPTLIDSGWYPSKAKDAEARLRYYTSQFDLVEVDSSYYGMPSERNAHLWVERTPDDFVFNIKAYALLTQHPAETASLPAAIRHGFSRRRVYQKDVPAKIVDMLFEQFAMALQPLRSANKLGALLFQFPEWFTPSQENREYVERCQRLLDGFRLAIEFRNRTWMEPPEPTLQWLEDLNLTLVCVDGPQGFPSSMPPVVAATSEQLAFVRFHGRNTETWNKKGISAAERFNYRYQETELGEWVPRIDELAEQAREVHVLFNNCFQDHGVVNAKQLASMLDVSVEHEDAQPSLFEG